MRTFRRLHEFLEDWQYLLHREGMRTALPTIGRELSWLPYRRIRFHILACAINQPQPRLQPKIDLEILPFDASHLELVRAIHRPSEARLCQRRLERGQPGLIAFHRGRPAGYAWGCYPVAWELERVRLELQPGDILCTDVFTAPALRGQGVQTALTLARFHDFSQLGFRRAVCTIDVNNAPSLAVWQRKLGARIAGEVAFLRLGPWRRVRCDWAENPATELASAVGGAR